MIATRFTELVGCSVPIQVAPMGAVSSPDLVAEATAAGAMGMIGTAGMSLDDISALLDVVLDKADGPVGANMLMPFADADVVRAVAPRVRLFDFYHGEPDAELVRIVRDAGAIPGWQVGSLEEARRAIDVGCEILAARGVEGGGRLHGNQPLWPLLNEILDHTDVPVLAAGGLATARDLAAVLAAGADGARMGTRFVATVESGAHPIYKQAIVDAAPNDTVLTTEFSVLWPEGPRPHRILKRSLDAAHALQGEFAGEVIFFGERRPMPKFAIPPPLADTTGDIESFAMYAGTSVGGIDAVEPASDVIRALNDGAERLLRARR